jgi:hypothetical protein
VVLVQGSHRQQQPYTPTPLARLLCSRCLLLACRLLGVHRWAVQALLCRGSLRQLQAAARHPLWMVWARQQQRMRVQGVA